MKVEIFLRDSIGLEEGGYQFHGKNLLADELVGKGIEDEL
jgi:hypothetical protein